MKESPADVRRRTETLENRISEAERRRPSRQCQSRHRDRPAGDCRQRPRADRRPRYGLITTDDDAGRAQDFVTAAGLPAEEHTGMAAWADRTAAVRALGDVSEP